MTNLTAFRHMGDAELSTDAHAAIKNMKVEEWLNICDYMLHGIRKQVAALRSIAKGDKG